MLPAAGYLPASPASRASDRPPTVAIRRQLAVRRLMARWRQRGNDGYVGSLGAVAVQLPASTPWDHVVDGDRARFVRTSASRWPGRTHLRPSRLPCWCWCWCPCRRRRTGAPGKSGVMGVCGCGVLVRQLGLDGRPVHTLPGSYLMRTATCASESRLEEK